MNMTNIICRRALAADYPGIIALHRQNLFLSSDFKDASQLATINEDVAVIVAVQENTVVVYVCATTQEYSQQIPLLKYKMSLYPETMFQGQPLSNYRSFSYGPVCVAAA